MGQKDEFTRCELIYAAKQANNRAVARQFTASGSKMANNLRKALMLTPFHLAINVTDLEATRVFYGEVLGAKEGRSTPTWVDFDFFGHQLSFHLGPVMKTENTGHVGDHLVPMPHFGMVLALPDWQALAARLAAAQVAFILPPSVRFEGEPGEQWTMFFRDPSGNPIEIKGFTNLEAVFANQ